MSGLGLSLPVKIWPQVGCRRMIPLTLQSSIHTDSTRVQGCARNAERFPNQTASLSHTTAKLRPSLMPFCILNQWQRVSIKPTLITLNLSQQEVRGRTQPLRQLPENLLQPCCVSHLRFLPQRLSKAFATDGKTSAASPTWPNISFGGETISVSQAVQPLPEK